MLQKPYAGALFVLLIVAIPIFAHLDGPPLSLYDESRLANSAIEMHRNNNWLIPTVDNMPDMWSTKPPLMIWLQTISIKLIGASELAVRLPAALAALATCLLLFLFCLKKLKEPLLGCIAVLVLITTHGYVMEHAIRTGDYDSILTLFMVAGIFSYFLYFEEEKKKYLYGTFVLFTLAGLTKGIESVMFLPGMFLYSIYRKKAFSLLAQKEFYIGVGIFLFFVLGYYLLRDHYNPGYIDAVLRNEVGGRYNTVIEGHKGDEWYYYDLMTADYFHNWYLLVIPGIVLGISSRQKIIRDITVMSLILIATYIPVLSFAQTKLDWYLVPVYPFLAIVVGIFLFYIYRLLAGFEGWKNILSHNVLPVVFLFSVFALPYHATCERVLSKDYPYWTEDRESMKVYLKDLLHGDRRTDSCVILTEDMMQDISWYYKALREKNIPVSYAGRDEIHPPQHVIAFTGDAKNYIEAHFISTPVQAYKNVNVYQLYERK